MTPIREALTQRWLTLTRTTLPAMAETQAWPIRHDHCFMRVCLDHAAGRPWHEAIPRPAIRNVPDAMLERAIAIAEHIAGNPGDLGRLNQASLAMRGKAKVVQTETA